MARSTYIYVVLFRGTILAPFTVKHEAQTYVRSSMEYYDPKCIQVMRFGDGSDGSAWRYASAEEFLA